jgi:hypothetical protein
MTDVSNDHQVTLIEKVRMKKGEGRIALFYAFSVRITGIWVDVSEVSEG